MKIKQIKKIKGNYRVHNIETEKNNNYFANNVLVHNCFAYFFKTNNPAIKTMELKTVNYEQTINALSGNPKRSGEKTYHKHFYKRKFLLHWGGLADPFCNFEKSNETGYPIMKALGELDYPCLFSFKGDAIFQKKFRSLFEKYSEQKNFAFQVSIITYDEQLAKEVEIGVPPTKVRLKAIKMLSDMGYWTILRLRPFIVGITDRHLPELLEAAKEAGINAISTEFFALDTRANKGMKTRYDWLSKVVGIENGAKGMQDYYKALSPSERGGYMRLNRDVKEHYIKYMYKFCQDNDILFGCSDPDFKELNMSGSCCGMPDDYPDNRGLENWTRAQMTYHLKEARLAYHRTGKKVKFYFNEVYKDESYLDEVKLAQDHVTIIGMCEAERKNLTQKIILQGQWNNLRSPSNPRNYFHGKVMPCGVDDEGNLVFQYEPHPYEARWIKEGISLDKR